MPGPRGEALSALETLHSHIASGDLRPCPRFFHLVTGNIPLVRPEFILETVYPLSRTSKVSLSSERRRRASSSRVRAFADRRATSARSCSLSARAASRSSPAVAFDARRAFSARAGRCPPRPAPPPPRPRSARLLGRARPGAMQLLVAVHHPTAPWPRVATFAAFDAAASPPVGVVEARGRVARLGDFSRPPGPRRVSPPGGAGGRPAAAAATTAPPTMINLRAARQRRGRSLMSAQLLARYFPVRRGHVNRHNDVQAMQASDNLV